MTVFATAAATLNADTNLSVAATYRQGNRGAGAAVRIIRTVASDVIGAGRGQYRVADGSVISVLATDGTPNKGDTWALSDGTILTAIDVARSAEGDSYEVTVR